MKKKYIYIFTLVAASIILTKTLVLSNSGGVAGGLSGAPDDLSLYQPNACGTGGCHSNTPLQNNPSLAISLIDPANNLPVNTYQMNYKYIVRIELTRASLVACGFQSTVETKSGNVHIGTITTKLKCQYADAAHQYVTHINSNRTNTGYGKWEYYWMSPAIGQSDIIIYAAANDANGDGTNFGDSIFLSKKTYSHNSGIETNAIIPESISFFPNPVKDNITVKYKVSNAGAVNIDIYNLNGQLVYTLDQGIAHVGDNILTKNIGKLEKGMYFVRISAGNQSTTQKILKE